MSLRTAAPGPAGHLAIECGADLMRWRLERRDTMLSSRANQLNRSCAAKRGNGAMRLRAARCGRRSDLRPQTSERSIIRIGAALSPPASGSACKRRHNRHPVVIKMILCARSRRVERAPPPPFAQRRALAATCRRATLINYLSDSEPSRRLGFVGVTPARAGHLRGSVSPKAIA